MHALIVDHNDINRLVMEKILKKLGVTVDVAATSQQALEYLERCIHGLALRRPDVIFMKMKIGPVDGLETTHIIRTQPPFSTDLKTLSTPIIALTNHSILPSSPSHLWAPFIRDGEIRFPVRLTDVAKVMKSVRFEVVPAATIPGNQCNNASFASHNNNSSHCPGGVASTLGSNILFVFLNHQVHMFMTTNALMITSDAFVKSHGPMSSSWVFELGDFIKEAVLARQGSGTRLNPLSYDVIAKAAVTAIFRFEGIQYRNNSTPHNPKVCDRLKTNILLTNEKGFCSGLSVSPLLFCDLPVVGCGPVSFLVTHVRSPANSFACRKGSLHLAASLLPEELGNCARSRLNPCSTFQDASYIKSSGATTLTEMNRAYWNLIWSFPLFPYAVSVMSGRAAALLHYGHGVRLYERYYKRLPQALYQAMLEGANPQTRHLSNQKRYLNHPLEPPQLQPESRENLQFHHVRSSSYPHQAIPPGYQRGHKFRFPCSKFASRVSADKFTPAEIQGHLLKTRQRRMWMEWRSG
ncbi:hypothetical protein PAAG_01676 [Paracoccidioides lutzii Pb01]|uniref:Response regulatory domain-containing protein n=1 Tax=Paracoccidioides lutzii (strain ATCC MYA-826 / Pb01) TaxID=502779 RepID=C1GT31_PARBA|nr:hypothetical protein PAAG_01676 [Paracoccidioides lutzii Pb01]EEH39214.2 hypothetical protein PAAG_01676 [Paracoccidioides lutzii Pb01]